MRRGWCATRYFHRRTIVVTVVRPAVARRFPHGALDYRAILRPRSRRLSRTDDDQFLAADERSVEQARHRRCFRREILGALR